MITLVTGVPGAGKTLYAVSKIVDNLKSDLPRPIFTNVDGLDYDRLKCFPLSEAQIYDLKQFSGMSAIVIIDECQRFYPPRPSGSKVPEYISYFNVHRHDGLDVILISQGPKLIDKQLRDVVGEHIHFTRPFNMRKNFMYRWTGCNDDPEPSKSESNAVRTSKALNKDLFKYYHSTVENTHSSSFPIRKLIIFGTLIFFAISMFVFVFASLFHKSSLVKHAPADGSVSHQSSALESQISDKSQNSSVSSGMTKVIPVNGKYINNSISHQISGKNTNNNNNIHKGSIVNTRAVDIVGYVSGSREMPVLSRHFSINDFHSYYYDMFNDKFYLCFGVNCAPARYDVIIRSSKYLPQLIKYVETDGNVRRCL